MLATDRLRLGLLAELAPEQPQLRVPRRPRHPELLEAIKDSNDKFFYQVADWIWQATDDKNWLPHFYERFGFGHLTGMDWPARPPEGADARGEKELYAAMGKPEEAYWSVGDWVNPP